LIANADDRVARTAAQVIADAAIGPLRNLLIAANASGDTAWGALGKTNFAIGVFIGGGSSFFTAAAATEALASFDASSPGVRSLNFLATHTGALPCIIEIRLVHSMWR
jgi:hypothetical protein